MNAEQQKVDMRTDSLVPRKGNREYSAEGLRELAGKRRAGRHAGKRA